MSSDKNYGTIADQQGNPDLTTAYGTQSAGWTTKGIDVSMFDFVQFEFSYTHQDTAALLSLKPMTAERQAADLDDYVDIYQDPDNDGTMTLLELTLDVSGMVDASVNKGVLPPIDVRAMSMLRMAAKVDDDSDDPELVLRYIGNRADAPGQLTSRNVT